MSTNKYKIIFKNEVIDYANTQEEAELLQREYQIAFFNPMVTIEERVSDEH